MKISSIVAVSDNNVIGVDNDLPWHLPSDLKYFKDTTFGHHVLMGRKSFDSVGRPLPGRTNIIVTRNKDFYDSHVHTVHSIDEGIRFAIKAKVEELFILGGANIYLQTKDIWDRLYLTKVHTTIAEGTAFFPQLDYTKWQLISETKYNADEKNPYDYTFCVFDKLGSPK